MVQVKYDNRVLIPQMQSGESIILQTHNYKMPGNITITTEEGYLKPEGTKVIDITQNVLGERYDVKEFTEVILNVTTDGSNPQYNGEYTIS